MMQKGIYILIALIIFTLLYRSIYQVETDYFPSGDRKTRHITNRISGKLKVINYYENGNIEEESIYKIESFWRGVNQYYLQGPNKKYYSSGELKASSNYVNGLLNGLEIVYYKNGAVYSIVHLEQNTIVGDGKVYYEDGTLKAINKYKDNRPYYIKVYPKNEQDSMDSLIPLIDVSGTGGRKGDTITFRMKIYTEGTPYKVEDFVINYELLGVPHDLDFSDFPPPRYQYHFENGKEKTVRFVIDEEEDADYLYGYLAEKASNIFAKAHRDFFILIPKDSFSITFPSNDTSFVKDIK